ncbi:MAG: serine/threonine-protein kinase, partial [Pyrinomonadaceae bacterium]
MIEPGTLLQNRYLLNDKIGQGGMGAVYIATDQRFGSTVAVKETFFTDVNLRKAFEREARLLNSLRHNALPRVSDHFVEGEGQFLVMEFIGGDDLSTLLEKNKGPFPVDRVLGWAEQLLDALEYLHEQTPSIIHRDIKPQNLKLTDRDHIILLDFGLAKGAPSNLSRVTNTGSVFGYSRSYAPLEQIQGTGTDLRSDLYSLAATLYHLLTGVTPPDAVTRATAVINGQEDPMVPANEINPKVSPAVAAVLASALAQNANQRPASAREMRHALETADRTPGAGRVTAVVGNDSPTIHDQATQLLTPRTSPMTGAQAFVAAGAATVADPKLQGTGTDP